MAGSTLPHPRPTGSSSGWRPSITARYFSSCPSDSASRRTPCPQGTAERWLQVRLGCVRLSSLCPFRLLHTFPSPRPTRNYPRLWIRRSSFERRRDLNPPKSRAAQRTVRFVDPPGAVGWFQFQPASLVQFGCVALHPAPNGGVGSSGISFHAQFLDVPIRQREPQIPTDRANNDLGFEVPPFKQGWSRFGHRLAAYQTRAPCFCNTSPVPVSHL